MSKELYFTVYWLNGSKSFTKGADMKAAFDKNWGAGAIPAVDFIDDGLSNSHRWNGKGWEAKQALHTHENDFTSWLEHVGVDQACRTVLEHVEIEVKLNTDDILVIREQYGNYDTVGWVHCIQVFYGELVPAMSEEEEDSYTVVGMQNFAPDDIKLALAALKDRFDKITNRNRIPVFNPNNAGATSLEEIASKQLFN